MMRSAEGRRRTIVDSDGKTFDDENPLFGWINGAPRFVISIHVAPTNNRRKKRDVTETQYLLEGKCKIFRNNMTYVCSDCANIDAVKNEMWVCHPKKNCSYFSHHLHSTHNL